MTRQDDRGHVVQLGALVQALEDGLVAGVGASDVTLEQLDFCLARTELVGVTSACTCRRPTALAAP